MILDYTPEALADLDSIWDWNARQHDSEHADAYIEFLSIETHRLKVEHALDRPVPSAPLLKYRVIQKRNKGHGHIVIYEVIGEALIRVVRYFHTAQDWPTKLSGERG